MFSSIFVSTHLYGEEFVYQFVRVREGAFRSPRVYPLSIPFFFADFASRVRTCPLKVSWEILVL